MALIVKIEMSCSTNAGIELSSSRDIVLWGPAANTELVSRIGAALQDIKQLFNGQITKSQTDLIREVCDQYAPGCWDFASHTKGIKF